MALYIIFAASLIAITIMIGVRIRQLRAGKTFEHRVENLHLPEIHLQAIKTTTAFYSKRFGHLFVLLMLRVWIKLSYFIKRKAKELEPKIKRLLTPRKHRHDPEHQTPVSNFLKSVSEYKKKIKRVHEHMKKQEESKIGE